MKLINKMGYQQGKCLGNHGQGRLQLISVQERPQYKGLGFDQSTYDYHGKKGHIADHHWSLHPEQMPKKIQDHKGKQTIHSSNDSEGEPFNQNFIMKIAKRTYPCTLCGSSNHCVDECWKHKYYNKKVHATRSSPRKDDATSQVKKS